MGRKAAPIQWTEISITISGKEVHGSYNVDNTDFMTVGMNRGWLNLRVEDLPLKASLASFFTSFMLKPIV